MKPSQTAADAITEFESRLRSARTSDPRIEAELIISEATGIPRLELLLDRERLLSSSELRKANAFLARRLRHEPLQYVFGKAYFRNLSLKVGPGVLVPRPETETLVELAMKLAPPDSEVLDIATGSGAIAISIAQERPDLKLNASDISGIALRIARKNGALNRVRTIKFKKTDLLDGIRKKFSVITANLPYINAKDYAALPREIRGYEPKSALIAGKDGLKFIRRLISSAHGNLDAAGHLILEISPEQEKPITRLFNKSRKYSSIRFEKDLCGKIRFCILRK